MDPVVVKDDAGAAHQAIRGAIGKLKRAVATALAKHGSRQNTELPTDPGLDTDTDVFGCHRSV